MFDIIGDIHGCYEELINLITIIGYKKNDNNLYAHKDNRILIFLGDLCDRGKNNLDVINLVMDLVNNNLAYYVIGNHCMKLYRYFKGANVIKSNGLDITISEFNKLSTDKQSEFSQKYISFIDSQEFYLSLDNGNLVVAHAGIKEKMIGENSHKEYIKNFCLFGDVTGKKLSDGRPERYDWAKDYRGESFIVYGHTPVNKPIFRNNTIDIDQGCVFGGYLTSLQYPEMKITQVKSTYPLIDSRINKVNF